MKRINEIVVVEGKTDSQLLKELYDVDTIDYLFFLQQLLFH